MSKKKKITIAIILAVIVLVGGWWFENKIKGKDAGPDVEPYFICPDGSQHGPGIPKEGVEKWCKKHGYTTLEKITITTNKKRYVQGEIVKIAIQNKGSKNKCISPREYEVEVQKGGEWKVIKQIWCPCGALCNLAPCRNLPPGEKINLEWYQKESWCKNSKTISQQVNKGTYRIKIQINGSEVYSDQFQIK